MMGFSAWLGVLGCDPQAWEAQRQRLQPVNFEKIQPNMTQAQVLEILGKPHQTITYALKPDETYFIWRWRSPSHDEMLFGAVFGLDKLVLRTETWRDPMDPKQMGP